MVINMNANFQNSFTVRDYKSIFTLSVFFAASFILGCVFIKYSDIGPLTAINECVKEYINGISSAQNNLKAISSLAFFSSQSKILILLLAWFSLYTPFCRPVIYIFTLYEGFSLGLSAVCIASYISEPGKDIFRHPVLALMFIVLILTACVFITLLCFCRILAARTKYREAYLKTERSAMLSLSALTLVQLLCCSGALVLINSLCFLTSII